MRADRITADGRTLRYVDSETLAVESRRGAGRAAAGTGALVTVPAYKPAAAVTAGVAFSTAASGFRPDTTTPEFAGLNAYVLDDGTGVNRFPTRAGTDGLLTQPEVARILAEAIKIANRARAQIRQPLGSPAQVTHDRGRHERRDRGPDPHAGCAGIRHRRLGAEGAHRAALLEPDARPPC